MGFGKTSAMINFINKAEEDKHFVFVTPYLDELVRVRDSCPSKSFVTPEAYDDPEAPDGEPRSKLIDMKDYLRKKQNIATTHALFERFDEETIQLVLNGNYTLVMDEVANTIHRYDISPYDAKILNTTYCEVDEDGMLEWKDEEREYFGDLQLRKNACDNGTLWYSNQSTIIQMIPPAIFEAFDDVYLMTYLFDAQLQRAYFDIFGIEYQYLYVYGDAPENYYISDQPREYKIPELKKLIRICDNRKLNLIGRDTFALSKGWHEKNADGEAMKALKNCCTNFLRHYASASSDEALFTTYKDSSIFKKEDTSPFYIPRGYATAFLSCNARATNKYRTRTALAYPINRFIDQSVKMFITQHGVTVDNDKWALSEMIQWIWRSAIRDGKEICLYVPSRRMRTILENWIEEMSTVNETESNERKEEERTA